MRILSWCFSALLLLAPVAATAKTLAFEDNKLNYKSCDGEVITARWRESNFSLSLPGKSLGDAHEAITYQSWDGSCLTGRWDENAGHFKLDGENAGKTTKLLNYIAADGSKWAGVRAGSGFFVARVADAGAEVTSEQISDLADWLERKNEAFTPGAALAGALKSEIAQ